MELSMGVSLIRCALLTFSFLLSGIFVRVSGAITSGKPTWQTEISNFENRAWDDVNGQHGAFSLGLSIQVALLYGKTSAWVWWQGTDSDLGPYDLTGFDMSRGKTFYASKQFYRFVRPGAKMVGVSASETGIVVTAFEHPGLNNFVVVICNDSPNAVTTSITGANVPATFTGFQNSAAGNDTCRAIGNVKASEVTVPARGILTLVSGSYIEAGTTTSTFGGSYNQRGLAAKGTVRRREDRLSLNTGKDGSYRIALFGMKGKIVKMQGGVLQSMDLSALRAGVYTAVVVSGNRVADRTVVAAGKALR
jgi:hypothetical protein